MTREDAPDVRPLEVLLGHSFRRRHLLERALTHASSPGNHNERLEFLGDAVLDLVVADLLFRQYPDEREGRLTEWKSLLVSRETLARVGERLGVDRWIRTGSNLEGRESLPRSLLGDAMEALLGAVWLDCDENEVLPACRRLVTHWLRHDLAALPENYARAHAKQLLQHWAQQHARTLPAYRVTDFLDRPDAHAFRIEAEVAGRAFPAAWGGNKKEAERRAAWEALLVLRAEGAVDPEEWS